MEWGFENYIPMNKVMQKQKHELLKQNTGIVKSLMIESISLQHYIKVQVKYLNH